MGFWAEGPRSTHAGPLNGLAQTAGSLSTRTLHEEMQLHRMAVTSLAAQRWFGSTDKKTKAIVFAARSGIWQCSCLQLTFPDSLAVEAATLHHGWISGFCPRHALKHLRCTAA